MSTERNHRAARLSAGIIVVRHIDAKPNFLLLRAYEYWDFPKGIVEPGEQPLVDDKVDRVLGIEQ